MKAVNHQKRHANSQAGFTLVEIIAVLVLLGILAAVAVPKFMNIQDEAAIKSANAAKMELQARAKQYSALSLLSSGGRDEMDSTNDEASWGNEDLGSDFDVFGTNGTNRLYIKVASVQKCYQLDATFDSANKKMPYFGGISGPVADTNCQ